MRINWYSLILLVEGKAVQTLGKTNHWFAKTWVNLRNTMLHWKKLDKVHIVWFHLYKVLDQAKVIYVEISRTAASGRKQGDHWRNGHEVILKGDEHMVHLKRGVGAFAKSHKIVHLGLMHTSACKFYLKTYTNTKVN